MAASWDLWGYTHTAPAWCTRFRGGLGESRQRHRERRPRRRRRRCGGRAWGLVDRSREVCACVLEWGELVEHTAWGAGVYVRNTIFLKRVKTLRQGRLFQWNRKSSLWWRTASCDFFATGFPGTTRSATPRIWRREYRRIGKYRKPG